MLLDGVQKISTFTFKEVNKSRGLCFDTTYQGVLQTTNVSFNIYQSLGEGEN